MVVLLAITAVAYGTAIGRTLLSALLRRRSRDVLTLLLAFAGCSAAFADTIEDAVVMVGGCSGVCVDSSGQVLTAKHCELPATVTVRFKDRAVTAERVYFSRDSEGPVVYDCEGEGYPSLPVAASPPQIGERVWSYGYPQVNGHREFRWNSGPLLRWSTFDYGGGAFNGNVVGFRTASGWSGGPLLNAKGEVCGLLNSTDCNTSVFISSAAVRQAYAAVRQRQEQNRPADDGRPKLYVFGSTTCGPCRQFKADYDQNAEFRQALEAAFAVEFVDVNKQVDVADQFDVTEVPTFLVPAGLRLIGYESPEQLLVALGVQQEIAARPPPPPRNAINDGQSPSTSSAPTHPEVDATEDPAPPATETARHSEVNDRLDRLTGLVQSAVSIATWLGVGGMTGGAGGLILGGLALWRTLRRRRTPKPARDPPARVTPPPVVTIDSPPLPQAIVPETHFAPYERDTFAEAFAWAEAEIARKYPGSVSTLETLKGLINQFLAAKGVKSTK
ncbi:MAG: trypsin-like peptidase domain-containing protein [Planctomycetaceae bacterium]|nr:trypsin-like peptidase domain-containing protein [Planctomycetaceae bacterium]